MLGDVARRDQQLSERHRVVREEVEFQVFLSVRIRIDNSSDVDDKPDHQFGNIIAWSSLSSEEHYARVDLLALLGSHGFEREVSLRTQVSAFVI